jgi:NitT/TauT family transport system substrate-binding protein
MNIDEKVRRLHGLRIGISSPGSSTDAFVRSLFLARGLDPDKEVRLQPFGSGSSIYAAFQKKLTDGIAYPAPIPETAAAAGLGKVVIDPFTGEVPELNGVPYVVLATTRKTLADKPATVAAVMRALTKAVAFIQKDPEAAKKLMRQYFPDIDGPVFDLSVSTYIKGSPKSLAIAPDEIAKAVAWMNTGAEKKVSVAYKSIVVPGAAEQAATPDTRK